MNTENFAPAVKALVEELLAAAKADFNCGEAVAATVAVLLPFLPKSE